MISSESVQTLPLRAIKTRTTGIETKQVSLYRAVVECGRGDQVFLQPVFSYQSYKMAPPTLYYTDVSPPVRSVLLTSKALGLELDLKQVNLFAGEHLKPEYLKVIIEFFLKKINDFFKLFNFKSV